MKEFVYASLIFMFVLHSLVLSDHILSTLVNHIDLPEKVSNNEGMNNFGDIHIDKKEDVRISIQTTTLVNIVVKVNKKIVVEQKQVNNFNYHCKNLNAVITVEGPKYGRMYVIRKYDLNVISYYVYFIIALIILILVCKLIFI